jgi:hypothetical protein
MTKPLVYVKTQVKVDSNPEPVESWELLAFGESPIMHAAYNPVNKGLVCQFNSIKENFVDIPKQNPKGKVTFQERRAEQYYRVVVTDKEAIEHILNTYVSNYADQNWDVTYEQLQPQVEEEDVNEEVLLKADA